MAGRPYHNFYRKVATHFGEDRIMEHIAEGKTIGALQKVLTEHAELVEPGRYAKFGRQETFSRSMLYDWLDEDIPGQGLVGGLTPRRRRYNAARRMSADALVDRAADRLDGATPADISVVREQAKLDVWRAGKFNRDEYGDKPMEVNINLGSQHLDALRIRRVEPQQIPEAEITLLPPGVEGENVI